MTTLKYDVYFTRKFLIVSMSNAISIDRISKSYGDFVAVNKLSMEVNREHLRPARSERRRQDDHDPHDRQHHHARLRQITLFGRQMSSKLQERVGYLPEDRGLYKKMKVGDQLAFFAELKGLPRRPTSASTHGSNASA